MDITRRLKIDNNRNARWKDSFEEGVDPSDVNQSALPEGSEPHGDLHLKLIRTQWRYDFTFATPSRMYIYIYN